MSSSRIDLLQQMPVFGAASADTLSFILEGTRDVVVPAGECFFRRGDEAHSLFVLESGRVEVTREHEGRDFRLTTLGPGDCFGEMAFIEVRSRNATVRALEDCAAIEIPLETLHALYERDVDQYLLIQMNLAREISRRLREASRLRFESMVAARQSDTEGWWYVV